MISTPAKNKIVTFLFLTNPRVTYIFPDLSIDTNNDHIIPFQDGHYGHFDHFGHYGLTQYGPEYGHYW